MTVEFTKDMSRLRQLQAVWQSLADNAGWPNIFFEPWFILSAVSTSESNVTHAFVWSRNKADHLIGYMPLQTKNVGASLRPRSLETWKNLYCFSGQPLIATGCEEAFWESLLDGIDRTPSLGATVRFKEMCKHDAGFKALEKCLLSQKRWHHQYREFDRAILHHSGEAQTYLQANLTKKKRKEYNRLRRRFEEEGELQEVSFETGGDVDVWIDQFLELEKKGWKGASQTALGSRSDSADFFIAATKEAAKLGKLDILKLSFNQQPVAMLVTYVSTPRGSFTFKIAYDETFAKYSPGVLLQLAYLKRALDLSVPATAWSDSCAAEDHPMINKIWRDRLTLVSVKVAPKRPFAKMAAMIEHAASGLSTMLKK